MKIGELIKTTRKAKRMTQADLAKAIGVDRSTIAKYESGVAEPSIETIGKISNKLERDLLSALGEINEFLSSRENAFINLDANKDAIHHTLVRICMSLDLGIGTYGEIDDVDGYSDFYKAGDDEPCARISHADILAFYDRLIEHGSIEFKVLVDANTLNK